PTLQDDCGCSTVDIFAPDPPAALPAGASSPQGFVRLQRRPALVHHVDRKAKALFELGGEVACRCRECAWSAIRIIRGSDYQNPGMQRAQQAFDRAPVRPALRDCERSYWGRAACERVTAGESYSFESKIESENGVRLFVRRLRHAR